MGHSTSSGRTSTGATAPQETESRSDSIDYDLRTRWFTQTAPGHFNLRVQGAGSVNVVMTRDNGPAAIITTRLEGGRATEERVSVRDRDDAMEKARERLRETYRQRAASVERNTRIMEANDRIRGTRRSAEEINRRANRAADIEEANRRRRGR